MAAPVRAFKFEPEHNQSGDDSEGSTWDPPVDNLAGTEAGVGQGGWNLMWNLRSVSSWQGVAGVTYKTNLLIDSSLSVNYYCYQMLSCDQSEHPKSEKWWEWRKPLSRVRSRAFSICAYLCRYLLCLWTGTLHQKVCVCVCVEMYFNFIVEFDLLLRCPRRGKSSYSEHFGEEDDATVPYLLKELFLLCAHLQRSCWFHGPLIRKVMTPSWDQMWFPLFD